jgi:lysophospholipase L1-like esterase
VIDSIVLVGDSIRLSYQPYVAVRVRSTVVWGPGDNCRSSRYLLENLDGLVLGRLRDPSLVHLNVGAHDIKREPENGFKLRVGIDEYRRNLALILARLRAEPLVADVIVATTTPVMDERHQTTAAFMRHNADVVAYNFVLKAAATAARYPVNDLYGALQACPFDPISEDGIHLNEPGKEYAGSQVAAAVKNLIGVADRAN